MIGFLNFNKPPGISSRNVVDRISRIIPKTKIGHAGTLDPIATGVLVLAVGGATRLIQYLHEYRKSYQATFLLGHSSESDDVEREVTINKNALVPTEQQILDVIPGFVGEIEQVPPTFSALKVDGKRAYKLARRGQHVEMKPRKVSIFQHQLLRYEYPELELGIQCSAGTYIRSIGRDLAKKLDTTAVMSQLCRTEHGPFNLDQSEDLEAITPENIIRSLVAPQDALTQFPTCVISEQQVEWFRHGIMIDFPFDDLNIQTAIALNSSNQMVALIQRKGCEAKPAVNFSHSIS